MPSASASSHSRTLSDPFADTNLPSSSYPEPRSAPPLQTKHPRRDVEQPSSMPEHSPRDVPTVKPVDPSPRHKMGRSTTSTIPAPSSASATLPLQPPKNSRSLSQDSVSPPPSTTVDKRRQHRSAKKGSVHADVIDRLDYSGIGAAMFHHDGPFDACAPSRNRHRTKAPMLAWSNSAGGVQLIDPTPTPGQDTAQMLEYAAFNDSPYPTPTVVAPPPPPRMPSDIAGRGRLAETLPKKRTDALAEAWGVAEPEPFEEFLAGGGSGRGSAASSLRAGKEGHSRQNGSSPTTRRGREGKELRDAYIDFLDEERPPAPRRHTTRSQLPPPQPIFATSSEGQRPQQDVASSPPRTGVTPKRSRSLMHRIRKMRETPNVPVASNEGESDEQSPPSSSEGRFDRADNISPMSDKSGDFVLIDDARDKEKNLPKLPPASPDSVGANSGGEAYFDGPGNSGSANMSRRTSLMRKVVRGVKRAGK